MNGGHLFNRTMLYTVSPTKGTIRNSMSVCSANYVIYSIKLWLTCVAVITVSLGKADKNTDYKECKCI